MSYYDYDVSKEIGYMDYPFYALLFALIRQAGSDELAKIERVFPEAVEEFRQRYHAPAGVLMQDSDNLKKKILGENHELYFQG